MQDLGYDEGLWIRPLEAVRIEGPAPPRPGLFGWLVGGSVVLQGVALALWLAGLLPHGGGAAAMAASSGIDVYAIWLWWTG